MVLTVDDIEKQVAGNAIVRMMMGQAIRQLKDAEKKIGTEPLKILFLGKRKLDKKEYAEAAKRFGSKGLMSIETMEHLTIPQKQYLFRQMGWDEKEVV